MSLDFSLSVSVDTGRVPARRVVIYRAVVPAAFDPIFEKAGCHAALHDSGGKEAGTLVDALRRAAADISAHLADYRLLTAADGSGTADQAIQCLHDLIAACRANRAAVVEVGGQPGTTGEF